MTFVKLGDDDYVDPDEVEFFYRGERPAYDGGGEFVKVFMKSGNKTFIYRTLEEVAAVLNETRSPF